MDSAAANDIAQVPASLIVPYLQDADAGRTHACNLIRLTAVKGER